MARPKKTDGLKQPAPVAPAPVMVPMPTMAMQQQHQQLQHQMAPQHQLPQAIAQQPPMQGMQNTLPPQQRTIGIDEFIRVRDSVSCQLPPPFLLPSSPCRTPVHTPLPLLYILIPFSTILHNLSPS